ncbi:hypothetical protein GCM10010319_68110 [Streptomyces blastmyceticus]|uniref:Helix-turn-helix domain-containing protein n=1 Tax=Streptomyces blastmyceticus TaxID=68180 RepID=A0ABN0Y1G2_9ACTN
MLGSTRESWPTPAHVAAYLGGDDMTAKKLEHLRLTGQGPNYLRLTNSPRGPVRYRRQDLDAWEKSRLVDPAAQRMVPRRARSTK